MNYETWRATFQSSEQAARAAFAGEHLQHQMLFKAVAQRNELDASLQRLLAALNTSIMDWLHCGVATNGRTKEDAPMKMYAELKAAIAATPASSLSHHDSELKLNWAKSLPQLCDGKEQEFFEAWAKNKGHSLEIHPLHYLFLNAVTGASRDAWREAITYCRRQAEEDAQ